jgi:hypothetical protein
MAHAEDGCLRESLAHQPIEARLRSLVHGRGGFIEKEPVGLLDKRVRDRYAILSRYPRTLIQELPE